MPTIAAAYAVIEIYPFSKDIAMKRHPLPPGMRALAAFIGAVVLAVLAAASVMTPDIAVQSADSTAMLPNALDQILPANLLE